MREAELADRRLATLAADKAGWVERRDGARNQIATLDQRIAEAKRDRAELENAPQVFAEKRQALIGEVETAEAERRACADRLQEAENALAEADRDARAALEAASAAREELGPRRGTLRRRQAPARRHRPRNPRHAGDRAGGRCRACRASRPGEALPELAEIEATLERLRRERERLGAVNLRAEEELREIETQHTSLDHRARRSGRRRSRSCASASRASTARRASGCCPRSSRSTSTSSICSRELFGGGTAELQLIESDDPLEAGLEILAKPPGKKPATLSLLSGGEQALTALALIFAVFLTNPAPICVLDEVDAPLDDHNVERFCDLLDEMTKSTDTRFVIITHNPITMARMNRLYGVTMAERGVSQLVSVDLEAAVRFREAG